MSVTPITTPGRASPVDTAALRANTAPPPARAAEPAKASEPLNLSGTAVAARALAAAPPVDGARVADLRARIADGSYRADPAAIAGKMIALDLP